MLASKPKTRRKPAALAHETGATGRKHYARIVFLLISAIWLGKYAPEVAAVNAPGCYLYIPRYLIDEVTVRNTCAACYKSSLSAFHTLSAKLA
jgi:hypothetical protein